MSHSHARSQEFQGVRLKVSQLLASVFYTNRLNTRRARSYQGDACFAAAINVSSSDTAPASGTSPSGDGVYAPPPASPAAAGISSHSRSTGGFCMGFRPGFKTRF